MQIEPTARKPALAALMSFILPGFGQLYNGEVNKAIWLFLLFTGIYTPAIALAALYVPAAWMMAVLALGLLGTLALWLYGMVDAWRGARALVHFQRRNWQSSGMYMLVLVLCNLVVLPLLIGYVRTYQVEAFRVPSSSMAPTIVSGDFFFADKRYNCPGCKAGVQRGDIAVFLYPNDRTQTYIKRIIGLPGDHVRIGGMRVAVNGVALGVDGGAGADGSGTERSGERQWQVNWSGAPVTQSDVDIMVAPGQVLVLGDNRNASRDSREFGTVPLQEVVGKARQVWFSYGPDGIRWARLGKVLN